MPYKGYKKLILILGFAILLAEIESLLELKIEIASLLGVMTIGFIIMDKLPNVGERLSIKLNKVWVFSELLLFVLVGAQVNIHVAFDAGKIGVIIILIGLLGRSLGGVLISLLGTDLNWKERFFLCDLLYTKSYSTSCHWCSSTILRSGVRRAYFGYFSNGHTYNSTFRSYGGD